LLTTVATFAVQSIAHVVSAGVSAIHSGDPRMRTHASAAMTQFVTDLDVLQHETLREGPVWRVSGRGFAR
jgi:hypothetical protein